MLAAVSFSALYLGLWVILLTPPYPDDLLRAYCGIISKGVR